MFFIYSPIKQFVPILFQVQFILDPPVIEMEQFYSPNPLKMPDFNARAQIDGQGAKTNGKTMISKVENVALGTKTSIMNDAPKDAV